MPEVSGSNDVVLRLSLRMDPGEAGRLAKMTGDEVKRALGGTLSELEGAHKRLAQAMTDESRKQAQAEIKAYRERTRELTAGLKEIEREQKRVTAGMSSNWRRTMEDLENFTTVARGAFDVIRGGAERLKAMSEEVIRVSNIYRSLTGSIDEAAEATQGTVENIDLIVAKNAAQSAGLNLSSKEFAEVAKAADAYGDAVGISAKEALEPFVASLAAGNERMLKRIGILVDSAAAEKRYAAIVEQSVESLTEQQKRAAFVDEAMKQIIASNAKLNDQPTTFADRLEQAITGVKNTWHEFVAGVGNLKIPADVDRSLSIFGRLYSEFSKDNSGMGPQWAAAKAMLSVGYGNDVADANLARIAQQGADFNRKLAPDEETDAALKFLDGGKRRRPTPPRAPNIVYQSPDTVTGLDRLFYQAALKEQETLAKIQEDAWEHAADEGRKRMAEYLENLGTGKGGDRIGFAGGAVDSDYIRDFTKAQGMAAKSMRLHQASGVALKDARGSANLDEDIVKQLEDEVKASREKAGGGLFGQLLFGDDTSLDQTYARMDEFKQRAIDTIGEMTDFFQEAGKATTDALGHSLAAYLAEGNASGVSAKKVVHELTKGLAQQAAAKAAWEGVEALASAIGGDFPGAAQHGAKAAIYGTFAATMGATSRATFSAPSAGSTPTNVRGSTGGIGGGSRSSGGGGGDTTFVFQFNGFIGDSEAIIRDVGRGIDAYRRKNSRLPWGEN